MKNLTKVQSTDKRKVILINALFATSIIIILSGATFSIYSIVTNANLIVLNSTIPGLVFGLVITFLGVRYFLSVRKLKVEVYKKSSKFSWSNFKKAKPNKILSKSR